MRRRRERETNRLIEEEDPRILQQQPRHRQTLLLTSRDHHPPLSHLRLPLIRQALNRLADVRQPRRLLDLLIRCAQPSISDVVHDVAVEERRLLRYDAHFLPQALELDVSQLLVVDEDSTPGGLVEAEEEAEDCRFAAAGGTDDGDLLAGGDGEGDVLEDGAGGVVAEGDVFEADLTTSGQGEGSGSWGVLRKKNVSKKR